MSDKKSKDLTFLTLQNHKKHKNGQILSNIELNIYKIVRELQISAIYMLHLSNIICNFVV